MASQPPMTTQHAVERVKEYVDGRYSHLSYEDLRTILAALERAEEALKPFGDAGEFLAAETTGFMDGDEIDLSHDAHLLFDALEFGHFRRAHEVYQSLKGES